MATFVGPQVRRNTVSSANSEQIRTKSRIRRARSRPRDNTQKNRLRDSTTSEIAKNEPFVISQRQPAT